MARWRVWSVRLRYCWTYKLFSTLRLLMALQTWSNQSTTEALIAGLTALP